MGGEGTRNPERARCPEFAHGGRGTSEGFRVAQPASLGPASGPERPNPDGLKRWPLGNVRILHDSWRLEMTGDNKVAIRSGHVEAKGHLLTAQ